MVPAHVDAQAGVREVDRGRSSIRLDRLDTSFDPLRVVVDGRDFDADVWSWCHQEEWTFDQQPYWLAVTGRPGRATRPLLVDGVDPEQQGIPVG